MGGTRMDRVQPAASPAILARRRARRPGEPRVATGSRELRQGGVDNLRRATPIVAGLDSLAGRRAERLESAWVVEQRCDGSGDLLDGVPIDDETRAAVDHRVDFAARATGDC